jgi:hypothetical protein
MSHISNEKGWRLESLSIRFNNYGPFEGKYTGDIKFQNKQNEAFVFQLSPERTNQYMNLIKEEVCGSAASLGERLIQCLNELTAPEQRKQIGEPLEHEPA